ncbi:MAG: polysaccharide biosynthesis protein [Candidatus Rokubacteria bacterium]|nr:polysaccharide biosynthesis protein [Candidatus Rokubacteria bacterium]
MSQIALGRVTALLLLGRAAGYVLTLGNSVILARVLGVDRLGAYAYAMGLTALFGLLPNMGISTVVTRTIAQDPEDGPGVVRAALRAQALLAAGVLLLVPAFAASLPWQPVPIGYVLLATTQLAVGTMSWPYLAVVSGRARYDRLAVAELGAALAGTACLLGAAALRGGVAAFLGAQVLAAGAAWAVARWVAGAYLPRRAGQALPLGTLFRRSAPFGGVAAVQGLYTRVDILLLGQMASTAAIGLYSAAYKPVNIAVHFGATAAGTLFPAMARAPEQPVPASFERVTRGLATAGPALALTLSGLAGPLLQAAYGADFAAAAPVLTLLIWSVAANWLYAPLAVALQARGYERLWLGALTAGLVVNAAGNLWAIPRWGAVGAAAATLASELTLLAVGAVLVGRALRLTPAGRPLWIRLGATLAGSALLWGTSGAGPLPSTLAALAVYGGLLVLFRVVTGDDVTMVIGWVRQATPQWSRP